MRQRLGNQVETSAREAGEGEKLRRRKLHERDNERKRRGLRIECVCHFVHQSRKGEEEGGRERDAKENWAMMLVKRRNDAKREKKKERKREKKMKDLWIREEEMEDGENEQQQEEEEEEKEEEENEEEEKEEERLVPGRRRARVTAVTSRVYCATRGPTPPGIKTGRSERASAAEVRISLPFFFLFITEGDALPCC
ncbi:hypothetical protein E2C01_059781 [Portunus trituberculatus]|uniref:Uncharacterized protein n=1 Tax=Portunus trituberculatus TaxID=210409 RepID=A0A5B7H6B3_PORTR|nr:hypothetical protein [Portunus trituberculatus]